MLWEVLIRGCAWGLSPRGLRRPVSGNRGVIFLWRWHISGPRFMLALVRVFQSVRGSSESSSSWSEAELGATICLWLCFLCEYEESFGIASEGATYWSEVDWLSTSRGGSAGPTSTSIASDWALVLDLGVGRSRWAAMLLDGPAFEAWGEGSTSAGFLIANSSRSDWNASDMDAWKEPICCWICIFKESPRDFSRFLWILFCKTVPGVGGTALAGVFNDKELKASGWGRGVR